MTREPNFLKNVRDEKVVFNTVSRKQASFTLSIVAKNFYSALDLSKISKFTNKFILDLIVDNGPDWTTFLYTFSDWTTFLYTFFIIFSFFTFLCFSGYLWNFDFVISILLSFRQNIQLCTTAIRLLHCRQHCHEKQSLRPAKFVINFMKI